MASRDKIKRKEKGERRRWRGGREHKRKKEGARGREQRDRSQDVAGREDSEAQAGEREPEGWLCPTMMTIMTVIIIMRIICFELLVLSTGSVPGAEAELIVFIPVLTRSSGFGRSPGASGSGGGPGREVPPPAEEVRLPARRTYSRLKEGRRAGAGRERQSGSSSWGSNLDRAPRVPSLRDFE